MLVKASVRSTNHKADFACFSHKAFFKETFKKETVFILLQNTKTNHSVITHKHVTYMVTALLLNLVLQFTASVPLCIVLFECRIWLDKRVLICELKRISWPCSDLMNRGELTCHLTRVFYHFPLLFSGTSLKSHAWSNIRWIRQYLYLSVK